MELMTEDGRKNQVTKSKLYCPYISKPETHKRVAGGISLGVHAKVLSFMKL